MRGFRAVPLAVAGLIVLCLVLPAPPAAAQSDRSSDFSADEISPPARQRAPLRAVMLYHTRQNEAAFHTALKDTRADTARAVVVQRRDPWLSFDKLQHFTFSFLFTVGGQYTFVNKIGMSENGAVPLSMGTAWLIGLLKELYDWRLGPRRYFSERDMVANSVGVLAATFYIVVF